MTDFEEQQRRAREAFASGVRMAVGAIPHATTRAARAKKCGVSPITVDRWVNGESFPNDYHLHVLSTVSGWPVDCIREGRIPSASDRSDAGYS